MAYMNKIQTPNNTEVNIADFRNAGVYYGTCATAAATQQKEVVITDARGNQFFELTTGAIFFVKFTNNQTYNGAPTMRINSTAATLKNIKRYGTTNAARYEWYAGEVVGFIYDGTNYVVIDGRDATTTYYGITKLYTGAGSSTEAYALTPKALYAWANAAVCPYYSTTSTYAVGAVVRYTNNIYVCNTAITTAEAWNAAHWTALPPIQEQINAIRQLPAVTTSDNGKTLQVTNGAWTVVTPSGGLPSVTTADNGKILRVVEGAWTAATVPDANGVSF